MRLFLLVFLTIYGGMNAYILRKFYLLWPGHRGYLWGLVMAVLFLGAAPILVRMIGQAQWGSVGRILSAVGSIWMALLFWLFCMGVALDAWNLGTKLLAGALPAAARWGLASRTATLASLVVVAIVALYSLHGASNVRLKELHLKTSRLPAGSAPIRIVEITDTHLSLTLGEPMLARVTALVEQAHPDLIALTGDAVDIPFERSRRLAPQLARLKAPLGKFAVTGNHEYYIGLENGLRFFDAAGFVTLRDEARPAGEHLLVAGVDDARGAELSGGPGVPEEAALPERKGERLVLFLKHRPVVSKGTLGRFDLQLSGHTHGGQIFPFSIVVWLFNRYGPGLHELEDGSHLYVSRGAGTWGPPMRFLAPPEVTLIVLEPVGTAKTEN